MVEEIEDIQAKIEKGIEKQEARVEKVVVKKQAQVEKGMVREALRKLKKKKLKGFRVSIKTRKAEVIKTRIARAKLLQAIVSKQKEGRPVNILRRVEDKIPSVLITETKKEEGQKKQVSFFGKGGIL